MPTLVPTVPGPVMSIGSLVPVVVVRVTSPGTTSVTVKIPGLSAVTDAIIQILDSGNNDVTAGADITFSSNTVVITDGGAYTMANTDTIRIIAWNANADQLKL